MEVVGFFLGFLINLSSTSSRQLYPALLSLFSFLSCLLSLAVSSCCSSRVVVESRVAAIGERVCLVLGIERERKGNEGGERR